MFSFFLTHNFIKLKQVNFKVFSDLDANIVTSVDIKKARIVRSFFKIYGFNIHFFSFLFPSLGINRLFFKKFYGTKKFFKYVSLFFFNKKLHIFLFLLSYKLSTCARYYRAFYFYGLKKRLCAKS